MIGRFGSLACLAAGLLLSAVLAAPAGAQLATTSVETSIIDVEVTSNPGSDGAYLLGDTIEVTVTFSSVVTVSGTPRLTLQVGSPIAVVVGVARRDADYLNGTGSAKLVFTYTVVAGDNDPDGVSIAADSLVPNNGSIEDSENRAALLTHRGLAAQSDHRVDDAAPTLSDIFVNGFKVTIRYSEPLDETSLPAATAFRVYVENIRRTVAAVGVTGKFVTLTLDPSVLPAEDVTASYTVPAANPLQDKAGFKADSFTNEEVTNYTLPTVSITPIDSEVHEGVDVDFKLTRTGPTDEALTVRVRVEDQGDVLDESEGDRDVVFDVGYSAVTLTLRTMDDRAYEPHTEVIATLLGYAASEEAESARVAVKDNDVPTMNMTLEGPTSVEEDTGQVTVNIAVETVSDDEPHGHLSVRLFATPQSAVSGTDGDYAPIDEIVQFRLDDFKRLGVEAQAVYVASTERKVTIHDDAIHEDDETFALHLERASGTPPRIEPPDGPLIVTILGNDSGAALSDLSLSEGTLSPVFAGTTRVYTTDVANSVETVTITAMAKDAAATFGILPADADGDMPGHQVALGIGDTTVTVTVTAEDGLTQKTYAVTVTRAAAPLTPHCDGTEVWCTAMTVGSSVGVFGYSSNYGSLIDPDFTLGGTTYTVLALVDTTIGGPQRVVLVLDTALGNNSAGFALHLGGSLLNFGDVTAGSLVVDGVSRPTYSWAGPSLGWSVRDSVAMEIRRASTVLSIEALNENIPHGLGDASAAGVAEFLVTRGSVEVGETRDTRFRFRTLLKEINDPVVTSAFSQGRATKTLKHFALDKDAQGNPVCTITFVLQPGEGYTVSSTKSEATVNVRGPGTTCMADNQDIEDPLTASFEDLPPAHGGENPFNFRIAFSAGITASAADLRDHALTVTGGAVTDASPMDERGDLWTFTVTPSGTGNVSIRLEAGRDCAEAGAICTENGGPLTTGLVRLVPFAPVTPREEGLTASFTGAPPEHDGSAAFTLRLQFSEAVGVSYVTLRDEALKVTNGTVTKAKRVDGRSRLWEITIEPDSDAHVTIVLPITTDCNAQGAVCTSSGTELSNRSEATVPGPAPADSGLVSPNSPATGAPTIRGTAQVGETLTADTTDIDDADGMSGAVFSYQWLANGVEVAGATSDTYTPVADDVGKAIKVKVSFRDDRNHQESLTSAAAAAVTAAADDSSIWSATLTVGESWGFVGFWKGVCGALDPDEFGLDGNDYPISMFAELSDRYFQFRLDQALPVAFTLRVGETTFESKDAEQLGGSSSGMYQWTGQLAGLTEGSTVEVSLTLAE